MYHLIPIFLFFIIFCSIYALIGISLFSSDLSKFCLNLSSGLPSTSLISSISPICGSNRECETNIEVCIKGLKSFGNEVENFDNFLLAFLQILRVLTLDNWSSLCKNLRSNWKYVSYIYTVSLAILGNFIVRNLFLAILKLKFDFFREKKNDQKHKRKSSGKRLLLPDRERSRINTELVHLMKNLDKIKCSGSRLRNLMTGDKGKSKFEEGKIFKKMQTFNRKRTKSAEIKSSERQTNQESIKSILKKTFQRLFMKELNFEIYSEKLSGYLEKFKENMEIIWEDYFLENFLRKPVVKKIIANFELNANSHDVLHNYK